MKLPTRSLSKEMALLYLGSSIDRKEKGIGKSLLLNTRGIYLRISTKNMIEARLLLSALENRDSPTRLPASVPKYIYNPHFYLS